MFELPIFWYAKFLLKKVGHDCLFLLSFASYAFRVIGYTLLRPETVHWVLPLEVLHGVTFASAVIASVDYSAALASKEWSTTVQSILTTVMSSVGGGTGPILGGFVITEYGFVFLYRGAGCIVGIVFFIHLGFWLSGKGHDSFLDSLVKEIEPGLESIEFVSINQDEDVTMLNVQSTPEGQILWHYHRYYNL